MITITGDAFLNKPIESCKEMSELGKLIINMEYPISKDFGQEIPANNKVNLKSDGFYLQDIFDFKPYAVTLANNHILDYGEKVALDTLETLNENNIKYFGFGNPENNYNNPCIIHDENVSISAYCCKTTTPYTQNEVSNKPAPLNLDLIEEDLRRAPKGYKRIVIIHWGMEEYDIPTPRDIIIARKIIDFGADLIIGHHAHVIQSNEVYSGKHIFYGVGNLFFPDLNAPRNFVDGLPSDFYNKKQAMRNKESLIIKYNCDTDEVSAFKMGFNRNQVFYKKNAQIPNGKIILNENDFNKVLKILRIRNKVQNFIAQPKLPTFERLKSILRV